MGRRQHPHIDLDSGVTAQPLDASFLEDAQQLGLGVGVEIANFIQEHGSTLGLLEAADASGLRPGEGAPFVAEQFALQERFGNRRAIDGDKGLIRAVAVLIKGSGRSALCRCRWRPGSAPLPVWRPPVQPPCR